MLLEVASWFSDRSGEVPPPRSKTRSLRWRESVTHMEVADAIVRADSQFEKMGARTRYVPPERVLGTWVGFKAVHNSFREQVEEGVGVTAVIASNVQDYRITNSEQAWKRDDGEFTWRDRGSAYCPSFQITQQTLYHVGDLLRATT